MSIKSQHTCEMTCDLCDKVYYEGPMENRGKRLIYPPTDTVRAVTLTDGTEAVFEVCKNCFAGVRQDLLNALGNRFNDSPQGFEIVLHPVTLNDI